MFIKRMTRCKKCILLPKDNNSRYTILIFISSRFRSFVSEPIPHKVRGESPFPNFCWADKQLMWDLMAKRETGTYTRIPSISMLENHSALQPKMRAILLGREHSYTIHIQGFILLFPSRHSSFNTNLCSNSATIFFNCLLSRECIWLKVDFVCVGGGARVPWI